MRFSFAQKDVAVLFEIGPQFSGDAPEGQAMMATGLRSSSSGPRSWGAPPRALDAIGQRLVAAAAKATGAALRG